MANSDAADLMSVGQHCAVPDCQQVRAWLQLWAGRLRCCRRCRLTPKLRPATAD